MPFPWAAIPMAMQAGVGLYQLIKGQSDADKLQRPKYERPEEVKTQRRLAEQMSQQGLTGASKALYRQQADRTLQAGLQNLTSRRAGLAGVPEAMQTMADKNLQFAAADEAARRANLGAYQDVLGSQAQYADKEFSYNVAEPYQQKAQAAQALTGAGLQNLYGVLGAGAGALAQGQYLNTLKGIADKDRSALMDFLNKKGTAAAEDLSGSGMYGGGMGNAAGVATSQLMGLGGQSPLTSQKQDNQSMFSAPNMQAIGGFGSLPTPIAPQSTSFLPPTNFQGMGTTSGLGIPDINSLKASFPNLTNDELASLIKLFKLK